MKLDDHQRALGKRLREIRDQQGLTLQEVEERSGGQWKGAVVGAYERGDRTISAPKLIELAHFYRIPVAELLPDRPERSSGGEDAEKVSIDLAALEDSDAEHVRALANYTRHVQTRRGDFNGSVLTLRAEDLRALSATFETTPAELRNELREAGLLFELEGDAGARRGDPDQLEVLIDVDGEPARRRVRVEPDGTLRMIRI